MKLLRWMFAGASVYVIYRYTIGKNATGEDVFVASDRGAAGRLAPERRSAAPLKRGRPRKIERV